MTANAYDEDVKKTKEAGMNAHITKPVNQNLLIKTLGNYYSKRKTVLVEYLDNKGEKGE